MQFVIPGTNHRCRHGKIYKADCRPAACEENLDRFSTAEFAAKPHSSVAAGVL
jgi:hypothetical protein